MQYFDYYGIPLPHLSEGQVPLGAIVSIKTIDSDGKIMYQEFKSPDLHAIEGLGMLDTFADTLRAHIRSGTHRAE